MFLSTLLLGGKMLGEFHPVEPPAMKETLSVLSVRAATSHRWLLSPRSTANVTKELSFKLYLIFNQCMFK